MLSYDAHKGCIPFIFTRMGLEVMDVGALCPTYNILVAEGRSVAAAVLIEPAG